MTYSMMLLAVFLIGVLRGVTSQGMATITPATDSTPLTIDLGGIESLSEPTFVRREAHSTELSSFLVHVDKTSSLMNSGLLVADMLDSAAVPAMPRRSASLLLANAETQLPTHSVIGLLRDHLEMTPPLFHPFPTQRMAELSSAADPFGWTPDGQHPLRSGIRPDPESSDSARREADEILSWRREVIASGGGIRVRRDVEIKDEDGATGALTKLNYDVTLGPGFVDLSRYMHRGAVKVLSCGSRELDLMISLDVDGAEEALKRWVPGTTMHVSVEDSGFECNPHPDDWMFEEKEKTAPTGQTKNPGPMFDDVRSDEREAFDEMYAMVISRELLAKDVRHGGRVLFVRFHIAKLGLHELFLEDDSHLHLNYRPGNISAIQDEEEQGIARRFELKKIVSVLGLSYNYDATTGKAKESILLYENDIEHHKDWSNGGGYTSATLTGHIEVRCSDCYYSFSSNAWLVIEGGVWAGIEKLEVSLYGSLKSAIEVTTDATAVIDVNSNYQLLPSARYAKIAFTILAVPVWFDVKFGLKFKSWLHFDGAFHAQYRATYVADADMGYSLVDGFYKKFEQTPNFPMPTLSSIVEQAQILVEGQAQLIPEVQMVWYSTVPVFARVTPYINLDSRVDLTQMKIFVDKFYWGISMELGLGKLEICGFDVWQEQGKTVQIVFQNICPGCLRGVDEKQPQPSDEISYWFIDLSGDDDDRRSVTDVFGGDKPNFGEYDPMWSTEAPRIMEVGYRSLSSEIVEGSQLYRSNDSLGIAATIQEAFSSMGLYLCFYDGAATDALLHLFVRPAAWSPLENPDAGVPFSQWDIDDLRFVGQQCVTLDYSSFHSEGDIEYMLIEKDGNTAEVYHELYPLAFLTSDDLGAYNPPVTLNAAQSMTFLYQGIPAHFSGGIVLTLMENLPLNIKTVISGLDAQGDEVARQTNVYTETYYNVSADHVREVVLTLPNDNPDGSPSDRIVTYEIFILANAPVDNTVFRIALTGFGLITRSQIFDIDPSDPFHTRLWRFQNLLRPYKFSTRMAPSVDSGASLRFFSGRQTSPKGEDDPEQMLQIVGPKAIVEPYEHFLKSSDDFVMMEIPESLDPSITQLEVRILYELISGQEQLFDVVEVGAVQDFVFSHTDVGMRVIAKIAMSSCDYVFTAMRTGAAGVEEWEPISPRKTFHAPDGMTSYYEFSEVDLSEEETIFQIRIQEPCSVPQQALIGIYEVFSIQSVGDSRSVTVREGEMEFFTVTQLEKCHLVVTSDPPTEKTLKFRRYDPTQTQWSFPATKDYAADEMATFDVVSGFDGVFGAAHDWVVVGVKGFSPDTVRITATVHAFSDPIVTASFSGDSTTALTDGFNATLTIANCPEHRFSNLLFDSADSRLLKILASFHGGAIWSMIYSDLDQLAEEYTAKRQSNRLQDFVVYDFDDPCSMTLVFPALLPDPIAELFPGDQIDIWELPADVFAMEDGRQVDPSTLTPVPIDGGMVSFVVDPPVIPAPCPGSCGGHGSCVVDECDCVSPWEGPTCEVLTCGPHEDGANDVCWEHGSCILGAGSVPECDCDVGFYGTFCESPMCFGLQGDARCSYQGVCIHTHECICNHGFQGEECARPLCNYETQIHYGEGETHDGCANNGTCLLLDPQLGTMSCSCLPGYTGDDCSLPVCFGVIQGVDGECSNHGDCVAPDTCDCSDEYSGDARCSTYNCDGVVCYGHGTCVGAIDQELCDCEAGWYAPSECEDPICDGVAGDEACSGDHGTCILPDVCSCELGWDGPNCEFRVCFGAYDAAACGGPTHGTCVDGDCECLPGWTGGECETPDCQCDQGTCSDPTTCVCDDPAEYYGAACDLRTCVDPTRPCLNGGSCVGDECSCLSGFYGSLCGEAECDGTQGDARCGGHGICETNHTCSCSPGWFTSTANNDACATPCPVGQGIFDGVTCFCEPEYYGLYCTEPRCFMQTGDDRCNGLGDCTDVDTCNCPEGWDGPDCKDPVCGEVWGEYGCDKEHSWCIWNFCECDPGTYGLSCGMVMCNGRTRFEEDCLNGGVCVLGTCDCPDGWDGPDCSTIVCDAPGCGDGVCLPDRTCDCSGTEFDGPHCEIPMCNGIVGDDGCEHGGVCLVSHVCQCVNDGLWAGDFCEEPLCPLGCSGHGVCQQNHTCACEAGFVPPMCASADGAGATGTEAGGSSAGAVAGGIVAVLLVCFVLVVIVAVVMFAIGCFTHHKVGDRVPLLLKFRRNESASVGQQENGTVELDDEPVVLPPVDIKEEVVGGKMPEVAPSGMVMVQQVELVEEEGDVAAAAPVSVPVELERPRSALRAEPVLSEDGFVEVQL